MNIPWTYSFPAEIMVCDPEGVILEMSAVAVQLYEGVGGAAMIGRNVFDHHDEPSRSQVQGVVARRKPIMYTTEKGGEKKLVTIAPWYQGEAYAGFVLLVQDLPGALPNIVKD
jgi:hypothetical protein